MIKKILPVLTAVVLVFSLITLGCSKEEEDLSWLLQFPPDDGDGATEGETNTVVLGEFTVTNTANQKGWCSNGTDDKTTPLTIDEIIAAKYLVLELNKTPIGGLQIIWQGDGNGWDWAETKGVLSDTGVPSATLGATLSGNVLKIELSKALKNYEKLASSTKAKIIIGYFSNNVADLGITKAYLICE